MTAARLREAAKVLRDVVGKLTTDTDRWDEAFPAGNVYGDHSTYERLIVHPGVGLALTDWLDQAAMDVWAYGEPDQPEIADDDDLLNPHLLLAARVADLILGGS